MKIHSIAIASIVSLAGTGTDTNAFTVAPARQQQQSTALYATSTDATTAAKVTADLDLVYTPIAPFGKGATNASNNYDAQTAKKVLGGKGANLKEMSDLGLSVPPGFTITTECCDRYCNDASWDSGLPNALWEEIVQSIDLIQDEMQSQFGSPDNPLLLSVRSGAAISMPGMVSDSVVFAK